MVKQIKSHGEALLDAMLRSIKAPQWEREFHFCPDRAFRADFAWPEQKILAEVQGGSASRDRNVGHASPLRYEQDCERMAEAVLRGYRVFWFTTKMVEDGRALRLIERALGLPSPPRWTPPKRAARRAIPARASPTASRHRLVLP